MPVALSGSWFPSVLLRQSEDVWSWVASLAIAMAQHNTCQPFKTYRLTSISVLVRLGKAAGIANMHPAGSQDPSGQ
jgi:hypothetical protein